MGRPRGRLPRPRVHPLHQWINGRDPAEVAAIYCAREADFWGTATPFTRAWTHLIVRLTPRLAYAAGHTVEQHHALAEELSRDLGDLVWYSGPLILIPFLPDDLCPPARGKRRHPQEALVWRSPWNVPSMQVHLLDLEPNALLPHVYRLACDLTWLQARAGDGYDLTTWTHDPEWQPNPILAAFLVEIAIGLFREPAWARSYFRLWDSYARTADRELPALPQPSEPPDLLLGLAEHVRRHRQQKRLTTTQTIQDIARERGSWGPSQVWRQHAEATAARTIHETLQQVRRFYHPDEPPFPPEPLS